MGKFWTPTFESLRLEQALTDSMEMMNKQINKNLFIDYPPKQSLKISRLNQKQSVT